MIGRTLGPYRITRLLGEGGMGVVYQATDNIEREVAIKALRPEVTLDPSRLERFRSEAIALGRLHHPNITSLFHLLEEDDGLYMVIEFVHGQTLDEFLRSSGPIPPRLALDILIDGLHGFEHAHSRGVIHRDIKASNLMVSAEGATKIMDFGIARMDGAPRLTQKGQQIGSLCYMSPEHVRGLEQDVRSDIYSLGILLFELLTGRVPYMDVNDFDLMSAHLEKAPPSVRSLIPSLPPVLDEVIGKALDKNPEDRFQSVEEMRTVLEKIASELPDVAPGSPHPVAKKTRPTLFQEPEELDSVPAPSDRYGTRLVGSPLPIPEPSVVFTAPNPPPAAPTKEPKRLPKAGLAGLGVLLVAVLAWAMVHRSSQKQQPIGRKPVARTQAQPVLHTLPKLLLSPRKHRVHSFEKPSSRRVSRPPVHRRFRPKEPVKIANHPQHHSTSGAQEQASLRSIIKGG